MIVHACTAASSGRSTGYFESGSRDFGRLAKAFDRQAKLEGFRKKGGRL
jgi:hypothetical protein